MDFAVDAGLAHAARDQLGVLGAEVEDEDFLVHVVVRIRVGFRVQAGVKKSRQLLAAPAS